MKKQLYIPVGNKKVLLTYTPDPRHEWALRVQCEEAGIDQGILIEDFGGLLDNIPLLVMKRKVKKDAILKVRLTGEEMEKLTLLANKKGFSNISSYVRASVLV